MEKKLEQFVKAIITKLQAGENAKIDAYEEAYALRYTNGLWQPEAATFRGFLSIFIPAMTRVYERFEHARAALGLETIRKIGFVAALKIAALDDGARKSVLRKAEEHVEKTGSFPVAADVDRWRSAADPSDAPRGPSRARLLEENAALRAENEVLKARVHELETENAALKTRKAA